MKVAGLYACCDILLHQWLTYLPSPKQTTDSASGADRSEVLVDAGIAQASLPITSPTSQGSVKSFATVIHSCAMLTLRVMLD